MATRLACPYLQGRVELTAEREEHIVRGHPELLPGLRARLERTVADPDEIRGDPGYLGTRRFVRWFDDLLSGKYLVVVVSSTTAIDRGHRIVTAFAARRTPKGEVEWKRP